MSANKTSTFFIIFLTATLLLLGSCSSAPLQKEKMTIESVMGTVNLIMPDATSRQAIAGITVRDSISIKLKKTQSATCGLLQEALFVYVKKPR